MLNGARILVAEDEALIGIDLADHLESFGAQVVGPVTTVSDGLRLIERKPLHAALLDFRLSDGEVTPLLKVLSERRVPTLIYTGQSPSSELRRDYPDVTVLEKPLPMHLLVAELADACWRRHATPEACSRTLNAAWVAMAGSAIVGKARKVPGPRA